MLTLETGLNPGFLSALIALQARYYCTRWHFPLSFETERLFDAAKFLSTHSSQQDLILRLEENGVLKGGLVVDGSDPFLNPKQAHLRWVILDETLHGQGFGKQMMAQVMAFLQQNYESCYLDTFVGLDAARHLYETHGFKPLTQDIVPKQWREGLESLMFEWKKNEI